jgi:VanZ family protein
MVMRSAHRQIILALYVGAVLVLMLAPIRQPRVVRAIPDADKIVHAALFGMMAAAFWWNLAFLRRGRAVSAVALATALACAVEVLQAFVPYRSSDPFDALAGLVGAVVGAFVVVRLSGNRAVGANRGEPQEGNGETGNERR